MSDDYDHALQNHVQPLHGAKPTAQGDTHYESEYNKWPEDYISDNEESIIMDTSRPKERRHTLEDMNKNTLF